MPTPELKQAVGDISEKLAGRPVTGIKGPIAPWYGAHKPPDKEEMGFVPNKEWDYKVANRTHGLGMRGEQLPEAAKGWDAHGRAYYGSGIEGWVKRNADITQTEYESALARESKWGQFSGGVWALLKGAGRALIGDPLVGISKTAERVVGTVAGLDEMGEGSSLPSIQAQAADVPEATGGGDLSSRLPRLAGADLVHKILSEMPVVGGIMESGEGLIEEDQSPQSFANRVATMSQNIINTFQGVLNPGIAGYNLARFVEAPDSYENKAAKLEAQWQAASILYTNALDPATRAEFKRRVEGGEDPALLAIELENPVAEFVGQMVFDPLNLFVGPGAAAADAAKLENAKSVFYVTDEIGDALKSFKHYDEASAVESLSKLSEASALSAAKTVASRADELGALALKTNAKRSALVDTSGAIMQAISYGVEDPDDMMHLLRALSRRASGAADDVAEATADIMSITKRNAKMTPKTLFSPASFDLGYVLRETMGGNPTKFLDEVLELVAAGDKAAVAEHAYKLFDNAAEKIYPSVAKRLADGEELGFVVGALHKMDEGLLGPVFRFANNVFSHIYMGMSPGYAMRNAIMDNFLISLDLGPTNPFAASRWHDIGTAWQGGAVVRAAERGISSPALAAGVTSKEGLWGSLTGWGLKLGEKVEKNSARLIVGKTVDKTMRRLLGKGLPTLDPILKAGGMSDDVARFLVNSTINNFGDSSKAANALRTRHVDVWKHLSQWASPEDLKALDGMGLLSHVEDSLMMSGNIDDGLRHINSVFDELGMLADSAMDEMPTVSRSNPALPDAIALTESGAGDATKLKFGAVIESNNNSMVASLDAMNAARKKGANLYHTLPPDKQQELAEIMSRYTVKESTWGELNTFATKSSDAFQQNIGRVRKSRKPLDLAEEWDNLGLGALRGEPSAVIADVSLPYKARKREFLRIAQDSFVDMKYEFWKTIREELFAQTGSLYDEMAGFMGAPLNQTPLTKAALQYQEADTYAKAFPFSDGLHYFRPPTPRFAVGGAGGETVFAALDDGIKQPRHLLNTINAQDEAGEFLYRSEGMSKKIYKDLNEVDSQTAYDVLYNRRYAKTQERIAGEAAEETFTIYQGRPAGFDPAGRYSTSWSKDVDYARNYAGERGQIFTKEVTNDEWLDAVDRTTTEVAGDEGAAFVTSDKVTDLDLEEGRFPEEFAADAEPLGTTVEKLDKEYAELEAKLWDPEKAEAKAALVKERDEAARLSDYGRPDEGRVKAIEEKIAGELKEQEAISARMAEIDDVLRPALAPTKLPPPATLDGQPSLARAMYEQKEGVENLRRTLTNSLEASRGQVLDLAYTDEMEDALKLWEEGAEGMVSESRLLSQDVATQQRDFILHDYRKRRNIDSVLGYVYPYQFWYTQTYQKMIQRIGRNPAIASNYLRYKDALSKIHAGAPDWWKYTVNTNELFGLDHDNPMYFNLEASLNPINGVTNVDFDDPYKRTSWFTGLLADMNKFGPSTHTLYSLAVAIGLYSQGEEDAASRWAGRIIPQTRTIKAVTSLAFDKPVELDPWVALLGDGLDPYERNRVGRAMAAMVAEGKYSDAEVMDAARVQKGDIWDEAVLRATQERAPGQISSFFLGVGFKGRTRSDIQIDKFYEDWHRMWEMEENMSPDELQRAISDMRKAYPFMDTLMLSKKGGVDRDRAFVYNVMSRIPPSMSDDIAKAADMNPELLNRFYEDKGHMEEWAEQDADRFMAGIIDISAVLDMPDDATRETWLNAKSAYQQMLDLGRDNFGKNIWELQDSYYALLGDDPDDRQKAYDMLDANPKLQQAMAWKDQTIMFSPTLSAYYTSLDKVEAYYKGEMYKAIEEELGPDIWDKWDEYNDAKEISDTEARSYWKAHPELGEYMDIKDDWEDLVATNTINVGKLIKPGPGPSLRDILGEMGIGSGGVQDFVKQYPTETSIPPDLLKRAVGNEAFGLITDGPPYPEVLLRKMGAMGFTEEFLAQYAQPGLP